MAWGLRFNLAGIALREIGREIFSFQEIER
jgi:hypothetical protein